MKPLGAEIHLALGQTMLLVTLLVLAVALGLVPNQNDAIRDGRANTALAQSWRGVPTTSVAVAIFGK